MKVLRKGLTWSLIFAMTFTPVMANLGLTSVMAEGEEVKIIVDKSAIEFNDDNLSDDSKEIVENATTSYVAAGAAEIVAEAAQEAAESAEASAEEAKNAAGELSEILEGSPLSGEDSVAAKIAAANEAVNAANEAVSDANDKIATANTAIEAANAAIEAANAAIATAKSDLEVLDAQTKLVNAAKAKADAEIALKTEQENLVKKLAEQAAAQKALADASIITANNNTIVDDAVSEATEAINNAGTKVGEAKNAVKDAEEKNNAWKEAADKEAAAYKKAVEDKGTAEAELAAIEESKKNLEEAVKAAEKEAQDVVDEVVSEIEEKLSEVDAEGLTPAEISENAQESVELAKKKTLELTEKTDEAVEAVNENYEIVVNGAKNGSMSKGQLQIYANAASAAADSALAYAEAAQETAKAAKDAEAIAKKNYEDLLALVEKYTKMLEDAQNSYKEDIVEAKESASEINKNIENAKSDISKANTSTGTLKGKIGDTKTAAEAANAAQAAANTAISDAENAISTANSKIATADDSITSKNEEIGEANEKINNYNDAAKTAKEGIDKNDEFTANVNKIIREEVQPAAKSEAEAASKAKESVDAANAAIENAKGLIAEINKENGVKAEADSAKAEAIAEIEAAKEALETASEALESAGDAADEAEEKLETAEQASEDAKAAADTAESQAAIAAASATATEDTLSQLVNGGKTYSQIKEDVITAEENKIAAEGELSKAAQAYSEALGKQAEVDAIQNEILYGEDGKSGLTKQQSDLNETVKTNQDVIDDLEESSLFTHSKIYNARETLKEGLGKYKTYPIIGKKWVGNTQADLDAAQAVVDNYNNAVTARDNAKAELNGENGINAQIAAANRAKEAEAGKVSAALSAKTSAETSLNTRESELEAANTNLAKVNEFVISDENTIVLGDSEKYSDLIAEINGKYGEYEDVDKDTSVYKIVKDANILTGTWNDILKAFGFDSDNAYEIEKSIEKKYGLGGFWGNDDDNLEILVNNTNGKCVITCTSLNQLSVLRAAVAESNAKVSEQSAKDASDAAAKAYKDAKDKLDAYNDAKSKLAELASLESEACDEQDSLKELDSESSLEMSETSGRYNSRNNLVEKYREGLSEYDEISEYDSSEYDNAKKAYEESKNETFVKYTADDKKTYTNRNKNANPELHKLLEKIDVTDPNVANILKAIEVQSDINFDVLSDILGLLESAKAAYDKAAEDAKEADEKAVKADEDAKKAREKADEALRIVAAIEEPSDDEPSDSPSDGAGTTIVVTPSGTVPVLPVATAGLPVAGVAGARRAANATVENNETSEVTKPAAEKKAPVVEKKSEVEEKETTLTTIKDEEVALAAAPEDIQKNITWWWLVIITVAGLAAYEIYRKYAQKKASEEGISKTINK